MWSIRKGQLPQQFNEAGKKKGFDWAWHTKRLGQVMVASPLRARYFNTIGDNGDDRPAGPNGYVNPFPPPFSQRVKRFSIGALKTGACVYALILGYHMWNSAAPEPEPDNKPVPAQVNKAPDFSTFKVK